MMVESSVNVKKDDAIDIDQGYSGATFTSY